jgi:N-acetylglucosaminyldiphosphoundecaprenol N-acetyl-beta-D-mannosaminyltransferase
VIARGKRNLLGVQVDAVDYEAGVQAVIDAARAQDPLSVSALAVHGVMSGVLDAAHRRRLNSLDLVAPDGQPVRWGLNWLYRERLDERVYGPELTRRVCEAAAAEGLSIYLYGSDEEVLTQLQRALRERLPDLLIAGAEPSRFRQLSERERREVLARIRASGARIVLVGLGCPRQEIFVYENVRELGVPMLAVGAAFEYNAGLSVEPPEWIQRSGLQWLDRLLRSPRRLWRRYLLLNPLFLLLLCAQRLGLWRPSASPAARPEPVRPG